MNEKLGYKKKDTDSSIRPTIQTQRRERAEGEVNDL